MAFMMPVMKNNYDIYKDGRSRKTSECSNGTTSAGGPAGTPSVASAMGVSSSTQGTRRQRMKSESFASSPSHTYRMQMQRCQSQKTFPRNASRTSQCSTSGALSPTRSFYQASNSPPKNNASTNDNTGSQPDLTKFHLRLVEKLRKSFRKDSAKRSWKASLSQREESSNNYYQQKESSKAENETICKGSCNQPPQLESTTPGEDRQRRFTDDHTDRPIGLKESPAATTATTPREDRSSCQEMQFTASSSQAAEERSCHAPAPTLVSQFGHRLTAPLAKCHKKLANLHIHHHHNHHHQQQLQHNKENKAMTVHLLSSTSTVELYKQESETSSLCTSEHKQLVKSSGESNKKSPEKSYGQLRNARRRKRLSFMRRCTKSAPG